MAITNHAAAIIEDAAALIAYRSAECAKAWREQPWNRVTIALAFAAGFGKAETDDPHPHALVVIEAAYALQRVPEAAYAAQG